MQRSLDNLPRTAAAIEAGMGTSHVGAQICVRLKNEPIVDAALGLARPGVAMTTDSMMIWLSSSKPVTAVAIAQLWERGLLSLDDPIAKFVPEFAANGKEHITIRHALTHTGGFRGVASRQDALPWEQTIAAIAAVRPEPNWVPGERGGYHIASSWYMLGEIVQRLTGRPFASVIREDIFEPIGMGDCWIGMPGERFDAYGDRLGQMYLQENGMLRPSALIDSREATISPRPGSNGRGPMNQFAMFYQTLLDGGRPILSPQTVEAITSRHRVGLIDQTFRLNVDWGLGFICNTPGEDMLKFAYGFGPRASLRAFGHGGNQSSLAMADPEFGLVVAVVFNGQPGEAAHSARMHALMAAIYEDLSL